MQFYLNRYQPGDPSIREAHPRVAERPESLPQEVDVLTVGCGPAGLVLAAQLSNFPEIRTAMIRVHGYRPSRPVRLGRPSTGRTPGAGRLLRGRADLIQLSRQSGGRSRAEGDPC